MTNEEKLQKKQEKEKIKAQKNAQKEELAALKKEAKSALTAEEKEKKKTALLQNIGTVVLVLLAVLAIFGALYIKQKPAKKPEHPMEQQQESAAIKNGKLSDVVLSKTTTKMPYMPTDIPNVFYMADAAGNVTYYTWNGTEFLQTEPTATLDFTITLSGQNIKVHLPYIEKNGVLTGVGLFTANQNQENVYIYNFIMFKIKNLPAAYQKDGHCLLLMHTDNTQAYFAKADWEQAFILNMKNGTVQDFLNDRSQMVGGDGGIRRSQYVICEEALTSTSAKIPFASYRAVDENGDKQLNIYTKGGKNGRDDVLTVENTMSSYIKPLEGDAFSFLRGTDTGLMVMRYENGAEKCVKSFNHEIGDVFFHDGDYILNTEDGTLHTTFDNTVRKTKGLHLNPQALSVSPDGKYLVVLGTSANAFDYYVYVYNFETEKFATFKDDNYAPHFNLQFIDDHTISYYALNMDDYDNVVLDIAKVH